MTRGRRLLLTCTAKYGQARIEPRQTRMATTSDGISAFGFSSFVVFVIWLVAVSVVMYRTSEPTPAI